MNKFIHPLHRSLGQNVTKTTRPKQTVNNNFQRALEDAQRVKVSKHAQVRLAERNIHISNEKWQQLSEKIHEANLKGVTDALVVMEDVALVVSTKNNTVVTALHQQDAENKIFTNINGTILL